MITRPQIITEARKFLGARWQHQGRTPTAIDCAGLIIKVAHNLGITDFDETNYARRPDSLRLMELLNQHAVKTKSHGQPGDILLLSFQGAAQHLAIMTDIGMIHAYAAARKVVEHAVNEQWRSRIVDIYQYPGVKD
jgi:cell wall-associated NlpC family hydrolase